TRQSGKRARVRGKPSALFFGLVLPARAADRGTEDVAETGTRIGRPEFGHRPLLLVDLAGLDRQTQFARGAVDCSDLGIDLLADREAVGTLLAAVTRQLRLADETGDAIPNHDIDTAVADGGDGASDDIAPLQLRHAGFEGVGLELLDAEADAL